MKKRNCTIIDKFMMLVRECSVSSRDRQKVNHQFHTLISLIEGHKNNKIACFQPTKYQPV
jgi:hypothetical protein